MLYLSNDDYYEVYLKSIITDFDRETLTMLYQPIIGGDAVSLYLSLYSDFKKSNTQNGLFSHSDLSLSTGYNIGDISKARRKLEGIGLLRTYYKKENDQAFYKYLLFAPKTPQEFFNDILFKGLLIEKIGEKNVQKLIRKYKEKILDLTDYAEITDTFKNVYNPDISSDSFVNSEDIKGGYGRKTRDISKGFDLSIFTKTIEETFHILPRSISKSDLKKISDIALLFGISEQVMADLVAQSYNPNMKPKIDFERLKELAVKDRSYQVIRHGKIKNNLPFDTNSKLGEKVKLMSQVSALDFLSIKQKNGKVSQADINLISELQEKYGLTSQVINPLIDYCLERNNNQLPKAYVTKIAAALVREGIETTLDTMNYLLKSTRKKTYSNKYNVKIENEEKEEDEEDDEIDSDILNDSIFDDIIL